MQIETFEQTEETVSGKECEKSEEALALIEKLGLKGQSELTNDKGERFPYRKMSVQEFRVYSELFPAHSKIEDYSDSMIPLRVLQVAAHAKELGIAKEIQVWGERGKPVDPILVGTVGYNEPPFLLARWGEALAPFDELYEKAKKKMVEKYKAEAAKKIADMKAVLEAPESLALEHLNGGWVHF